MKPAARPLIAAVVAFVLTVTAAACSSTDGAQSDPVIRIELPAAGSTASTSGSLRDDPIVSVVRRVRPAVVNVSTTAMQQDGLGGTETGQGTGTGFIVRADGIVVTNYHVVENAQQITVYTQEPNEGSYPARVIGGDATADLAVLKIEAHDLPTVRMGDSGGVELGQRVIAVGFALGLEGGPSVTSGIVSSLDRVVQAQDPNLPEGSRTYRDVIQTDAAINPGNSGGPLLDLNGEVVGINTAGTDAAENIGFAIAIDAARATVENAIANPDEPVAYLGVVSQTVTSGVVLQFDLPVDTGAYVVDVSQGGPADDAGITGGDIIVGFDGTDVRSSEQLGRLIQDASPGDSIDVDVVHADGSRDTVTVDMDTNPLP